MRPEDLAPGAAALLASVSVTPADVAQCAPLAGGTYNSLLRVVLRDGRRWVVKRPPSPGSGATLAYEHNLLRGETEYYAAALNIPDVPVPRLIHVESVGEPPVVAGLVMTECSGVPWHETDASLSPGERTRLRAELGKVVARLHTATGPEYGYPARPFGPPAANWRHTFAAMTAAVLDDAVRYDVQLPHPVKRVREVFAAAEPVLADVPRPVLVHFDLWQGNLLLDGAPGARNLSGVIDAERMFWGDPVAEFVSLSLFGDIEQDEDFLAGYAAAGGNVTFTDSVRLRLHLYRCYLYLIMLVEVVPRRYSAEQRAWTQQHAGRHLVVSLDAVASALVGRS
ncbi:aminoglycoside phosphotransferase family protein (plasmid) [Streptomyces sp. BB1-1-1]|uniref:phosphotransferase family protein n=1 Tax=Streptomyces sp. BB1-1-1 TaxID=3074430 RepID=UPI0028773494|nr:aminoglycoside phosphotransferase family protein [Streptomyces sp. BB1-1-1]WND32853.1 aminoglycoside phosphotransferase family protein [Streptomyces sp. BB1-1-1]WND40079.1 aminoglycoside phosphotransferase family protein [Streptomyces sp. BB1-1-1]WND40913.1 aminoglycoside phosphotransferase family protein [Streptomyces sp. BB1-1-1]